MQGRALEVLGHAIEYLIDSRLVQGGTSVPDNQAVHLLMAASRGVFEECAAVRPFRQRVADWWSSPGAAVATQA